MQSKKDNGAGDTLERILWYFGGSLYKRLYEWRFGRKCGCESRRTKLNRQFRYKDL